MTKFLFAIIISVFFAAPSFAQNTMMTNTMNMVNNTMLMMAIAEEENRQQVQASQQVQAPVVVHIQYQQDGTPVVTSSAPIEYVQAQPQQVQTIHYQEKQTDPGFTFFMGGILGLIMGAAIMFTVMRWIK